MDRPDAMAIAASLAASVQSGESPLDVWHKLATSLDAVFGFRLFTVLAFDVERGRLWRLHSSRPDINPVGGAKAVTESAWTQQVLREGRIFVGSTKDDIKRVFSDYAQLWAIGCESAINIPVRQNGVTVGTLNLLDGPHHYDDCSQELASHFAEIVAGPLAASLDAARTAPVPDGTLERV